ncbi:hypothetical protein TEA_014008 [Camellia sinensis var. sinensis]|uniref:Uncharacterized protein n=1 Tax=Camellia sinensis var. sinensis TaxID=542762 RepID=A0A4S4EFA9_CAMSN|nr:hypothetical protein TEA_014008 [Camellia sinensis var. sinensis]
MDDGKVYDVTGKLCTNLTLRRIEECKKKIEESKKKKKKKKKKKTDKKEAKSGLIRSEGDLFLNGAQACLLTGVGEECMFHPSEFYPTWTMESASDSLRTVLQICAVRASKILHPLSLFHLYFESDSHSPSRSLSLSKSKSFRIGDLTSVIHQKSFKIEVRASKILHPLSLFHLYFESDSHSPSRSLSLSKSKSFRIGDLTSVIHQKSFKIEVRASKILHPLSLFHLYFESDSHSPSRSLSLSKSKSFRIGDLTSVIHQKSFKIEVRASKILHPLSLFHLYFESDSHSPSRSLSLSKSKSFRIGDLTSVIHQKSFKIEVRASKILHPLSLFHLYFESDSHSPSRSLSLSKSKSFRIGDLTSVIHQKSFKIEVRASKILHPLSLFHLYFESDSHSPSRSLSLSKSKSFRIGDLTSVIHQKSFKIEVRASKILHPLSLFHLYFESDSHSPSRSLSLSKSKSFRIGDLTSVIHQKSFKIEVRASKILHPLSLFHLYFESDSHSPSRSLSLSKSKSFRIGDLTSVIHQKSFKIEVRASKILHPLSLFHLYFESDSHSPSRSLSLSKSKSFRIGDLTSVIHQKSFKIEVRASKILHPLSLFHLYFESDSHSPSRSLSLSKSKSFRIGDLTSVIHQKSFKIEVRASKILHPLSLFHLYFESDSHSPSRSLSLSKSKSFRIGDLTSVIHQKSFKIEVRASKILHPLSLFHLYFESDSHSPSRSLSLSKSKSFRIGDLTSVIHQKSFKIEVRASKILHPLSLFHLYFESDSHSPSRSLSLSKSKSFRIGDLTSVIHQKSFKIEVRASKILHPLSLFHLYFESDSHSPSRSLSLSKSKSFRIGDLTSVIHQKSFKIEVRASKILHPLSLFHLYFESDSHSPSRSLSLSKSKSFRIGDLTSVIHQKSFKIEVRASKILHPLSLFHLYFESDSHSPSRSLSLSKSKSFRIGDLTSVIHQKSFKIEVRASKILHPLSLFHLYFESDSHSPSRSLSLSKSKSFRIGDLTSVIHQKSFKIEVRASKILHPLSLFHLYFESDSHSPSRSLSLSKSKSFRIGDLTSVIHQKSFKIEVRASKILHPLSLFHLYFESDSHSPSRSLSLSKSKSFRIGDLTSVIHQKSFKIEVRASKILHPLSLFHLYFESDSHSPSRSLSLSKSKSFRIGDLTSVIHQKSFKIEVRASKILHPLSLFHLYFESDSHSPSRSLSLSKSKSFRIGDLTSVIHQKSFKIEVRASKILHPLSLFHLYFESDSHSPSRSLSLSKSKSFRIGDLTSVIHQKSFKIEVRASKILHPLSLFHLYFESDSHSPSRSLSLSKSKSFRIGDLTSVIHQKSFKIEVRASKILHPLSLFHLYFESDSHSPSRSLSLSKSKSFRIGDLTSVIHQKSFKIEVRASKILHPLSLFHLYFESDSHSPSRSLSLSKSKSFRIGDLTSVIHQKSFKIEVRASKILHPLSLFHLYFESDSHSPSRSLSLSKSKSFRIGDLTSVIHQKSFKIEVRASKILHPLSLFHLYFESDSHSPSRSLSLSKSKSFRIGDLTSVIHQKSFKIEVRASKILHPLSLFHLYFESDSHSPSRSLSLSKSKSFRIGDLTSVIHQKSFKIEVRASKILHPLSLFHLYFESDSHSPSRSLSLSKSKSFRIGDLTSVIHQKSFKIEVRASKILHPLSLFHLYFESDSHSPSRSLSLSKSKSFRIGDLTSVIHQKSFKIEVRASKILHPLSLFHLYFESDSHSPSRSLSLSKSKSFRIGDLTSVIHQKSFKIEVRASKILHPLSLFHLYFESDSHSPSRSLSLSKSKSFRIGDLTSVIHQKSFKIEVRASKILHPLSLFHLYFESDSHSPSRSLSLSKSKSFRIGDLTSVIHQKSFKIEVRASKILHPLSLFHLYFESDSHSPSRSLSLSKSKSFRIGDLTSVIHQKSFKIEVRASKILHPLSLFHLYFESDSHSPSRSLSLSKSKSFRIGDLTSVIHQKSFKIEVRASKILHPLSLFHLYFESDSHSPSRSLSLSKSKSFRIGDLTSVIHQKSFKIEVRASKILHPLSLFHLYFESDSHSPSRSLSLSKSKSFRIGDLTSVIHQKSFKIEVRASKILHPLSLFHLYFESDSHSPSRSLSLSKSKSFRIGDLTSVIHQKSFKIEVRASKILHPLSLFHLYFESDSHSPSRSLSLSKSKSFRIGDLTSVIHQKSFKIEVRASKILHPLSLFHLYFESDSHSPSRSLSLSKSKSFRIGDLTSVIHQKSFKIEVRASKILHPLSLFHLYFESDSHSPSRSLSLSKSKSFRIGDLTSVIHQKSFKIEVRASKILHPLSLFHLYFESDSHSPSRSLSLSKSKSFRIGDLTSVIHQKSFKIEVRASKILHPLSLFHLYFESDSHSPSRSLSLSKSKSFRIGDLTSVIHQKSFKIEVRASKILHPLSLFHLYFESDSHSPSRSLSLSKSKSFRIGDLTSVIHQKSFKIEVRASKILHPLSLFHLYFESDSHSPSRSLSLSKSKSFRIGDLTSVIHQKSFKIEVRASKILHPLSLFHLYFESDSHSPSRSLSLSKSKSFRIGDLTSVIHQKSFKIEVRASKILHPLSLFHLYFESDSHSPSRSLSLSKSKSFRIGDLTSVIHQKSFKIEVRASKILHPLSLFHLYFESDSHSPSRSLSLSKSKSFRIGDLTSVIHQKSFKIEVRASKILHPLSLFHLYFESDSHSPSRSLSLSKSKSFRIGDLTSVIHQKSFKIEVRASKILHPLSLFHLYFESDSHSPSRSLSLSKSKSFRIGDLTSSFEDLTSPLPVSPLF